MKIVSIVIGFALIFAAVSWLSKKLDTIARESGKE